MSNIQNERLAKTIRSKAFIDWFGDSKVVDENSEPLILNHATKEEFTAFDKSKIGSRWTYYGDGFYFALGKPNPKEFGNVLMQVFVNVTNPYYAQLSEKGENKPNTIELQKQGYDLSLIHISEPTRPCGTSRMPSSA